MTGDLKYLVAEAINIWSGPDASYQISFSLPPDVEIVISMTSQGTRR
jgi:hypothetical protein